MCGGGRGGKTVRQRQIGRHKVPEFICSVSVCVCVWRGWQTVRQRQTDRDKETDRCSDRPDRRCSTDSGKVNILLTSTEARWPSD